MKRALILFATIVTMTSCVPHHTSATQVGVRFNKMTGSVERADPGATYFFAPFVNDWKTFDVSTQNLVMTAQSDTGDRSGKDDLRFKTRDGNDIETDVTVRWRAATCATCSIVSIRRSFTILICGFGQQPSRLKRWPTI